MKRNKALKSIEMVLRNLTNVRMSNGLKSQVILAELESLGLLPPERSYMYKEEFFEEVRTDNTWETE